jgi:hypothetical protein
MNTLSDVAEIYAMMLSKGASEEIARNVAAALYRELMPGSNEAQVHEALGRAITMVKGGMLQTTV